MRRGWDSVAVGYRRALIGVGSTAGFGRIDADGSFSHPISLFHPRITAFHSTYHHSLVASNLALAYDLAGKTIEIIRSRSLASQSLKPWKPVENQLLMVDVPPGPAWDPSA